MIDWLEEINLETTGPAISMGVRKLGGRPWLVTDDCMVEELALKAELSKDKSREVFLAYEGTQDAGDIVLSLIQKNGIQLTVMDCNHPLEKAGLSVQEDLCLMQRTAGGWILKGASLSFPSRWQLHKKIGKNLSSIHGPVEGYEKNLSKKVDNFFDRMGDEPVWRRNWFIHPDNSLHQPQRPLNGDPIIKFNQIGEKLFVRSERQTLQHLEIPGWILFTIRVQRTPLQNLLGRRKEEFAEWVFKAPESHHQHKGLRSEQTKELQKSLK
jgi:hypothetical protein